MHTLKLICMTIAQLARQVWVFPQTVVDAVKKKRQRTVVNEDADERLDRLRNPSKYVGK